MHSLVIATIFSLLFGGGGSCHTKQHAKTQDNKSPSSQNANKKAPLIEKENADNDITVVAEGFHSAITKPFIAVIRDEAARAALAKLEPNLPKLDIDLKTNILVAAFLGERNTGGYSVEISRNGSGEIRIDEKKPGKDMMAPQMITSPFKVVSVASSAAKPVRIKFDSAWAANVSYYTITKGTFTVSGGFAGRHDEFDVAGGVEMMQEKRLVTLRFTLRKKEQDKDAVLVDFATGTIESNAIKIGVLSAGDLIPPPTNGLQATGNLTNHRQNLLLIFISLPTMITDGFGGGGTIEAVKVVPTAVAD